MLNTYLNIFEIENCFLLYNMVSKNSCNLDPKNEPNTATKLLRCTISVFSQKKGEGWASSRQRNESLWTENDEWCVRRGQKVSFFGHSQFRESPESVYMKIPLELLFSIENSMPVWKHCSIMIHLMQKLVALTDTLFICIRQKIAECEIIIQYINSSIVKKRRNFFNTFLHNIQDLSSIFISWLYCGENNRAHCTHIWLTNYSNHQFSCPIMNHIDLTGYTVS